ncbi:MAG: hypothetical protein IKV10_03525, partial [Alphaproteobacteria bacterium]|nr:hypothetical protein [Alphaproteobacteria bacterium]
MSRFLRVFAIVFGLFFAGNALAVDYTCDTVMQYDSCAAGYYMTLNGEYNSTPQSGNACTACPGDAAACPGGTYAPVYAVTLQASGGTLPSSSNTIYRTKNGDTGYIFESADVSTANVITKIDLPTRANNR